MGDLEETYRKYENIQRIIKNLKQESERVLRDGDLKRASMIASRSEHNWYLFSDVYLSSNEIRLINSLGARISRIRRIGLLGLYIITLEPFLEEQVQENEQQDNQEQVEEPIENQEDNVRSNVVSNENDPN
jgi:hypothetical protein